MKNEWWEHYVKNKHINHSAFGDSIPMIPVYDLGYHDHDRRAIDCVCFYKIFIIIEPLRRTMASTVGWTIM
jgi:hypothetical protein